MTPRDDRRAPAGSALPLLTLRVSRDGGRTWGTRTAVWSSRDDLPPTLSTAWPPCRCPRCAKRE